MHTFLRDGARFLQQQGWTLFSLEQKSFPYRNPSLGVFCGIFSIQELFLGLPKTWRASHPFIIQTWPSRNPCLVPSAYLNAFAMCAVSFWGLQPLCRRLRMYLQFHDAIVPGSHTTVSYDEPTSDGPFPSVSLFFYQFCPYQLPPTPYSRQLLFMLTVYGVFPSVVYVFF